jgi:hypothetical protein
MNSDNIYRRLPHKAKVKFYTAVFCTFAPVWAIAVTRFADHRSWIEVLFYFFASGITAVGWALAFTRSVRLLFAVIPLQILLGVAEVQIGGTQQIPFTIMGLASVACIVAGYILFVNFINTEGKNSLRLQTEIGLARQLHEHLVPSVALPLAWVDVYGTSYPSSEVGGDLVDGIVRDGAVSLFVADVSGHGMNAGVMMSMVKSALHMKLLHSEPDEALCNDLNRVVHRMKRPEMFVTIACLYIDRDRTVRYVLAGHPPILHYRRKRKSIVELSAQRPALGLIQDTVYPVHRLSASPGDLFLLLTDGLLEVRDTSGAELGLDTIKKVLVDHSDATLEKLADEIMAKVRTHGCQDDDQTLMLARML